MQLTIDYGTAVTVAVLTWPDGHWTSLLFDGSPLLPSAVYADPSGTLITGYQAAHLAVEHPENLVPHPAQHLHEPAITVGGRSLDVVDLIAATLRRVAEQATTQAGTPVQEVTLTVPAFWGPQRRTLLRKAATRAGLPQPRLVDTPVAVATRLLHTGAPIPVEGAILICDFGAGQFNATVVRRTRDGFDVLSTVEDPQAGGITIDTALAEQITGHLAALTPPAGPAAPTLTGNRVMLMGYARVAKESLAHAPVVAVPTPPPHPPIVLDHTALTAAAQPALTRAVQATRTALEGADLTPPQLAGVYCLGGTARLPQASAALHDQLGVQPILIADPDLAPVLGTTTTTGPATTKPQAPPAEPGNPGLRHYLAALVPGLASIGLAWNAMATAYPIQSDGIFSPNQFILANWGEYGMAALLALQSAITIGAITAVALHHRHNNLNTPNPTSIRHLLATILPGAAAIGLAVPCLYDIISAAWYGISIGPFLRWSLFTTLPAAIIVTAIGLLAARGRNSPPQTTWLDWLTLPIDGLVLAAIGMPLVQFGLTNTTPSLETIRTPALYLGALLLGIAIAVTITRRTAYRILIAPPLAITMAVIAAVHAKTALGVIYILVITAWWLIHASQLALGTQAPLWPKTASRLGSFLR